MGVTLESRYIRGEKVSFSLFESNLLFSHFGSVAGRVFHNPTVDFRNDYVLGFIICEIFTVTTLQDWVGCRRVSNAALANAALVLSSKIGKNIRDGGQHRKINPKSLGPAFSLCRRAGIDAALAKADFFFAGAHHRKYN